MILAIKTHRFRDLKGKLIILLLIFIVVR